MTIQIKDTLQFDGNTWALLDTPFDDYLEAGFEDSPFSLTTSSCWRRYVAKWMITNRRLYLVGLDAVLLGGAKASLETFFPDCGGNPVPASWFTGTIEAVRGQVVEREPYNCYPSKWELHCFIEIRDGNLISVDPQYDDCVVSVIPPGEMLPIPDIGELELD